MQKQESEEDALDAKRELMRQQDLQKQIDTVKLDPRTDAIAAMAKKGGEVKSLTYCILRSKRRKESHHIAHLAFLD